MQPKKTVKEIEREIAHGSKILMSISKAPYSFIQLYYDDIYGIGFSKCCPTDEWDEAKGIEIALRRAVRDIRRRLSQEE